jgi:TrkA-C domain
MQVGLKADVIGKTITGAGLRGIPGLFTMSIERSTGESVDCSDYNQKLEEGDTIWFAADTGSINFLTRFQGLELVQQEQVDKTTTDIIYRQFVQAS